MLLPRIYTPLLLACLILLGLGAAPALADKIVGISVDVPNHQGNHAGENLVDGDMATAWVAGGTSVGPGKWMILDFPAPVALQFLSIANGNQAKGAFGKYRRVTRGIIQYPDGTRQQFTLKPVPGVQKLNLHDKIVETLKIFILGVDPTSKDSTFGKAKVAVSEIAVHGDMNATLAAQTVEMRAELEKESARKAEPDEVVPEEDLVEEEQPEERAKEVEEVKVTVVETVTGTEQPESKPAEKKRVQAKPKSEPKNEPKVRAKPAHRKSEPAREPAPVPVVKAEQPKPASKSSEPVKKSAPASKAEAEPKSAPAETAKTEMAPKSEPKAAPDTATPKKAAPKKKAAKPKAQTNPKPKSAATATRTGVDFLLSATPVAPGSDLEIGTISPWLNLELVALMKRYFGWLVTLHDGYPTVFVSTIQGREQEAFVTFQDEMRAKRMFGQHHMALLEHIGLNFDKPVEQEESATVRVHGPYRYYLGDKGYEFIVDADFTFVRENNALVISDVKAR